MIATEIFMMIVVCFLVGAGSAGSSECTNTRDNTPGRDSCSTQLGKSSSCLDYIKWKDCDRACNLCACSTASGRTREHCSGHGVCEASCFRQTCSDAKCKCEAGWEGDKCNVRKATCTDGIQNGDETSIDCGGEACPACECTPVSLVVKAEFFEEALVKDYKLSEITRSSSKFQSAYNELDVAVEASGGYGAFSISASTSFRQVSDVASETSDSFSSKMEEETSFNKDFLQIKRRVITTITVNGAVASKETEMIVDSVPKEKEETPTQLYNRAKVYIANNFGHETKGQIVGAAENMYKETTCIEKGRKGHLYYMGQKNTICSPQQIIVTLSNCQAAALALGIAFKKQGTWSADPIGCYRWADDGKVYYNNHVAGQENIKASPICNR